MFATAIVLLVIAALVNAVKFIYMLRLADNAGQVMKRVGVLMRVSSIAFGFGVVAFVMEKHSISVVLLAVSMLAGVALALTVHRQPDSTDVSR
jgi:hypothetical protein